MWHSIVPPYLLAQIARLEPGELGDAANSAQRTLVADRSMRAQRSVLREREVLSAASIPRGLHRTIADAEGSQLLPGTVVRREGENPSDDPAVDEAYQGLGATYALFSEVYGRNSIDGKGLPLAATVHYGKDYDNAFWNGERMVFGDGDGQIFQRFTLSLTVIGHELTHAVTQYSANLTYNGQSGALNESVSDVFGALVEQYARRQTAAQASWLIGAGLFTDRVQGVALRSMKAPGTAYDDPVLGKDPQPATMSEYVTTKDDNGGVHLNSGIPNRAFYLVAEALGGNAWERAGQIWYDTIVGELAANSDFAAFANATVRSASVRFGASSAEHEAVRAGWAGVGIVADVKR